MKKTKTLTLLIAAITGLTLVASAQDVEQTEYQKLAEQTKSAKTWTEAANAESAIAAYLPSANAKEAEGLLLSLRNAYSVAGRASHTPIDWFYYGTLPKYDSDILNSDTWAAKTYDSFVHSKAASATVYKELRAASNPDEFDRVMSDFTKQNQISERFRDKTTDTRFWLVQKADVVTYQALRVNHPQALNWALVTYRLAKNEQAINNAIKNVATALKARDFNLTRANAWISQQNGEGNAVVFSPEELVSPIAGVALDGALKNGVDTLLAQGDLDAALVQAKSQYVQARNSDQIDTAIQSIARVLRSHDLNLVRANQFIDSQKNGTPFDLVLE